MFRTMTLTGLLSLVALAAAAGTFTPAPYLVDARFEANVDALTRSTANQLVERDLFGAPYATVVVGNVDVYDTFPYLESHYFQVVSDPAWGRLLYGEVGRGLSACDGAATAFGPLREPRGLSSDGRGRIYVADTGNDRVLVFQAVSEFEQLTLTPLYSVAGLNRPYDVAFSDGGTPYQTDDDLLYVANSGRNEVRRYTLQDDGARPAGAIGELGNGPGHFAGPLALTVGHRDGAHTSDVYVADAHNERFVRLQDTGDGLAWIATSDHALGAVTALETDHFGNLYAAAPQFGDVVKYTADLRPVASLRDGGKAAAARPRAFHVPFVNIHDHRAGTVARAGQGRGILVEQWDNRSGLRLLGLGVEVRDAVVKPGRDLSLEMTLTDHAAVVAEISDAQGRVVARHDAGWLASGRRTLIFTDEDRLAGWPAGRYRVQLRAESSYEDAAVARYDVEVELSASAGPDLPAFTTLLGNAPNPFNPSTAIAFVVPAGGARDHRLQVYDTRGRLVRRLGDGPLTGGRHEVVWNGRDERDNLVGAGVYLYRLEVGEKKLTGKMVLVK